MHDVQRDELDRIYDSVGSHVGLGTIHADEVMWVQELVAEHRPQHLLEIGMASGLSAGIFARLLEEHGGRSVTTVDHDNTFFGDPTKENGFLVEQVYPSGPVEVRKRPHTVAVDLVATDRTYEMAFIDANHQHPFPLLDLLAVWPLLVGPKIVVFHDLRLYKDQPVPYGIGPKYVFDQLPAAVKTRSQARGGNIFSARLDTMPKRRLESIAVDGLLMPWTLRTTMSPRTRQRTRAHLREHYAPRVRQAFATGLERFNVPYTIATPPGAGSGRTGPEA